MTPTLRKVAGADNLVLAPKLTGAEDFSFYQEQIPGLFFFVGISPKGTDLTQVAYNHSPRFYIDESGLLLGARALAHVAVDYLQSK